MSEHEWNTQWNRYWDHKIDFVVTWVDSMSRFVRTFRDSMDEAIG